MVISNSTFDITPLYRGAQNGYLAHYRKKWFQIIFLNLCIHKEYTLQVFFEATKLLIDNGANVNEGMVWDLTTPLHLSAMNGCFAEFEKRNSSNFQVVPYLLICSSLEVHMKMPKKILKYLLFRRVHLMVVLLNKNKIQF